MASPEDIRRRIEAAFPGARVQVVDATGGGDHFEVAVSATAFAGRSLVEQHQLVYGALGGLMGEIHALSLRTATP
jgi:stress-induced morphogen